MALRRIARWSLFVVAGLVLLAATSAIVVETAWFKDRLRRLAIDRAAEVLNGQLTVGELSGSLWRGFTLHHVVLQQSTGPVVSVETVALRYDPRILARGHFIFDELVLTRPVVHIAEHADGWNVAHLVKPTAGGGNKAVQFRRLTIVDGQVSVEPAASAPVAARQFAHVNAQMGLTYSGNQLDMTVGLLNASDSVTGWRIDRGRATYRGNAAQILATVNLESSAGVISGNVTATSPDQNGRVLDGQVDVTRLDLAPVLARKDLASDLTGTTSFQAVVPSRPSVPASIAFQATAPVVTAAGYHATNVRGSGSYRAGVLHFDAQGAAYNAWGTAKGEWRTASSRSSPNTWALTGRFKDVDARNVPASLAVPKLATRLAGKYTLTLAPGTWAMASTLDRSTAEGAEIARGTVVRADSHHGVPHYEARGRVSGLDPQRLGGPLHIATLRQGRFHGRVSGTFHVEGRGRNLNDSAVTAEAEVVDTVLGATRVPRGAVTLSLAARRLAVTFDGPFEHLTHETLGLSTTTTFDLSGSANGQVVFHDLNAPMSVNTLDVAGQATLGPSVIAGYDVDTALVDATLAAGIGTVRHLDVTGADLNATASGTVALDPESGESNLKVTVDAASLDEMARRLDRPIAGAAHLDATVTGPSDHLKATGTLNSRELKYGTTADALTLNSNFTAEIVDQQWRDPKVTADSKATFLKVSGTEIQQITARTMYHADRLDVDATIDQKDRTVQLAGGLLIHPDHKEVHLQRLAISTADVTWTLAEGSEPAIHYAPDHITVKGVTLARGEERIGAEGMLPVGDSARGASGDVNVTAENVQIADLNRLLLGQMNLTGTLNGQAHVTGTTSAPAVTSTFTIVNGSVQGTAFEGLTATVGYRERRVTLDATLDERAGARLTAVGFVPLAFGADAEAAAAEPMDLRIESTPIDLGLFQPLTSHVTTLKGTGEFNAHVTGSMRAPQINGSAAITDASFVVEATGVAYSAGNAALRFDGRRVGIEHLTLQDEHRHTLTAEGGLEVAGARDVRGVDVHVVLDDMDLLHNNLGEIGLDGDLKASGDLQRLTVTGQLSVDRGRLEVDKLLDRFTKTAYQIEPDATTPAAAGSLYENATVNVRLEMPDNVVVRARDLRSGNGSVSLGGTNVTLGGAVMLQKDPGQPVVVVGNVNAVRGYYEFQGRRFDVLRDSEVRFRGEQPIDPLLDVAAEREISGVTAQVKVRGTARQPSIQLSSYPPLDEGDVLSLIVFGQPMNQLGESQRINLAERAGALAAGAIATPLSQSIGRALDLDVFEIRAQGAGGIGPSISLGRQVGSRLFIGLRQEFGREDVSAVSFEYRISSLLRLVTSVAQGAQQTHQTRRNDLTGIDLIFLIRY